MLLPKSIRKFLEIFRGQVSVAFILLSVALGFWFGLTPGWYGIHVGILIVALVVNINLGTFLMFAGLGKALCFAAAPALYHAGLWAQSNLGGVLDTLASFPVIGITDFNRCAVAGATILGPVLGMAAGIAMAGVALGFRRTWLKLEENSERFKSWQEKTWVRWMDWFLLGKRAASAKSTLEKRGRIIRVAGVVVAGLVLLVSAVGVQFVKGERLRGVVAEQMTKANGAEVGLVEFDLTPMSGRVNASGIQITDPAKPERNRIRIDELTADAGLYNLSCGRIVVDNVVLTGVAFDEARETAGAVIGDRVPVEDEADKPFDPGDFGLGIPDLARLEEYFKKGEDIKEKLAEIAEWLPEKKPEPPPATPPQSYLEYLTARGPVTPTPMVLVRRAVLDDVELEAEEFGRSTITCTNLSDAPRAAGLPVIVQIDSQERPTKLKITCHYDRPEAGATIEGTIDDIDLKDFQNQLNPNNPVRFEEGTANAVVSGRATREEVDLRLDVQTAAMKASTSGEGFFGLDPRVANEALNALPDLKTTLRLVGPTHDPRLAFDVDGLTESLKTGLADAGKKELMNQLDKALGDKLPEGTPKVDDIGDDPLKAGRDAVEGLFGGKKEKKE